MRWRCDTPSDRAAERPGAIIMRQTVQLRDRGNRGAGLVHLDPEIAQPDEGPHDLDAHLRGGFAAEDVGGLDGAVLGECVRKVAPTTTPCV